MKVEVWETKGKEKIDVLVDANGVGWVLKSDFDYVFEKYKSSLVTCLILMLTLGLCVFCLVWF